MRGRRKLAVFTFAAVSVAAVGAVVATIELATLHRNASAPAHAPAFLTKMLGAAEPSGSIVRTPAPDVHVAVNGDGFIFTTLDGSLGISADDSRGGGWTAYENGAVRSTPTGPETVTISKNETESYRTVTKHHGTTTWRWRLDTTLTPRVSRNGYVGFFDGKRLTDLAIKPVAIFDRTGKNVTPTGLRWRVEGHDLSLMLDDRTLPVPYTIDPATFRDNAHNAIAGTSTFTVTTPSTVQPKDLLVLAEMSTGVNTTTSPTAPTDNSGGAAWTATTATAVGYSGGVQAAKKLSVQLFYKYAVAGDANATVTVSPFAGSNTTIGSIYVFRGIDSSQGVVTARTSNAPGSVATSSCPAITPSSTATQNLICIMTGRLNGSYSGATGMSPWTYRADSGATSTAVSTALFNDDPVSSTTPITARTSTNNVYASATYQVSVALGFADDTSPPSAPTGFTLSGATESVQGSGGFAGNIYYQGGASAGGGFTITGSGAADTQSGILQYDYPTFTGFTGTGTYTFGASVAGTTGSLRATNNANLQSTTGYTITLVPDSTPPAGGVLTVNGTGASGAGTSSWLNSGTTVTIVRNSEYAETQSSSASGLASSTLTYQSATLTNNSCGAFGGSTVIPGATSPTLSSGNCYRFTLTGTDNVGNATSISTTVKVDTTAPSAPTSFTASSLTQALQGSGGFANTVYFRSGGTGGFTLTATGATDAESNVSNYNYPPLTGFTGTGAYTFSGTSAGTSGSLTASNNAGLTGSGLTVTLVSDGTAPTGGALSVNATAASAGGTSSFLTSGTTVTIARTDYTEAQSATESGLASSTLAYQVATLTGNACGSFGGGGTVTGTTSPTLSSGNCYLFTLTGTDNVGNTAQIQTTVKVDTSAPSAPTAITASGLSNAVQGTAGNANRVYFKSGASGGFTVTASGASDADTGIGSYSYPALAGFTGTGAYTFNGSSTTQTGTVNSVNGAGTTSASGYSFTAQADANAPTGGALTVNGQAASGGGTSSYLTSGTTVTIARTDYTEAQSSTESGLSTSTLTYTVATLTGNSCGSFGGGGTIVGTTSPTLSSGNCYQFTLTGTDNVGNAASITTTIKVDTTAPSAPTGITGSVFTNAAQGTAGNANRIYFKSGAGGGFTVTASGAADADTNIGSYTYPALPGFTGTGTYTFNGSSTTQTGSITANNGAGTGSASGYAFTAQADANAPAGGALTVNGTAATGGGTSSFLTSGTTVTIARTDYTEAQSSTESGLAGSTLTYTTATLTGNTCGSFGGGGTVSGTTSPTLSSGNCYRFVLTGTDNVGNASTLTTTVKVDTTAPSAPTGFTGSAMTNAFQGTGGQAATMYFKSGAAGSFTVTGTGGADADTGVASYTYPALTGFTGTGTYSFTGGSTTQTGTINAVNGAGTASASGFMLTVQADANAPAGGALTVNGQAASAGGTSSYLTSGTTVTISRTDYTEAQSATESGLASSTLSYTTATLTGNTCGSFGGGGTVTGTTSPTLSSGTCYLFALTGTDHVGNTTSLQTTVKVDTSAPSAPTGITASGLSNAVQGTGGNADRVYFRSGAAGGFTVTASGAADADTGIGSYAYPALSGFTGAGSYTFNGSSTTQTGSVTAVNGAGTTSASGYSFTAQADGNAPAGGALTVNGGSTYLTSGTTVTISRTDYTESQSATESGLASSTLTYQVATLTADSCGSFGGGGTVTGTTSPTLSSGSCYRFTLTGTDNVGNAASITTTVKVDTTKPSAATAITAGALTNAFQGTGGNADRVYFKNGATGGFTVTASGASDADTGIGSYTYPALPGFTGSGTYGFDGSSATQSGSITTVNGAGNTSASGFSFTAQADGTAPSGGALIVNGGSGYITSGTTLTIDTRTDYTESQSATESGLASSTLTIEQGTLSANSCSSYGAPSTITGTTSQTVSTGHCYRLTLTGTDNVGNTASTTSIVKVDTTAPGAPSLAFSGFSNASYPGSGTKVYFRSGGAAGFTVTPTSTDGGSGIASYSFPSLGAGYSNTGGDYTLTGAATTQTGSVTATNNAGGTGAGTSFTAQADGTAPAGGALTVNGGNAYITSGTTLTIDTRTDYTEAQSATESGLASSTLTIRQGDLAGDSCSNYQAPSTITGTTSQTVSTGHCYLVSLTGTDNVGNTVSITRTVKVDTTMPAAPTGITASGLANAAQGSGGNADHIYFKSGDTGAFTVTASGASDGDTGITGYNYPALAGFTGTGSYSFDGSSTTQTGSVTATNGAGVAGTAGFSFTAQADGTAPAGGALTVNGGSSYITSGTTLTIDTRTDYTESQSATESGLASSTLTIEEGTLSNDGCASYGAPSTIGGTTSQTVSTGHCYRLTLTGTDNVGNAASITRIVKVDTTAPSAPSGFGVSGRTNAYYPGSGSTIFFKSGATGGFTVTATGGTDADTGIASYTYGDVTGFGRTGNAYTFDGSSTTQTGSLYAVNAAGTSSTVTLDFTAQADTNGPTGGALTVNGGATYATGSSVSISTTNFAETASSTESGLASNALTVETGTLAGNVCSGYGSATDITGASSQSVSSGDCYRFTLTGTDNVGNTSTVVAVVKADSVAPTAPSLSFSSLTNAYWPGSGTKVYFQGGATGGFTVTPSSTDAESGVASYTYPSLGSGFGNTSGTYTFDATAATQSGAVTATDNAGSTGSGTTFTAQADSTVPTGGALVVNGGSGWIASGTTLTIDTRTNYTETQSATESGLGSSTLTMEQGTLAGNSCSSYGAPSTITGTTSQTVSTGHCYRLTLTGTDNVGNADSITHVVKVDTTDPSAPTGFTVTGRTNAYYPGSGTTVFFQVGATGGFTLNASGAADAESDVASYGYGDLTGFGRTGNAYTFDGSSTTQTGSIDATNNAGRTGAGLAFTASGDSTGPTGGALTVDGSTSTSYLTSGTSVAISETDYDETASGTESGIASNTLTVQQGTLSAGSCGSYGSTTDITGQTSYTVASGNCYLFTLTGVDHVGNTSSRSVTVKVDTTAPAAPSTISVGGATNAYFPGSGTTVYFKGGAAGSFTITASGATDADTGIASYAYSSLTGFTGTGSYTFDGSPTTQSGTVAATNGAGVTGSTLAFTARADTTAPTGGALVVNGGNAYVTSGTTLTIDTRTNYTETQSATESGLASSVLTIEDGTLSGDTCSGYGAPTVISGRPDQTVADGHCYRLTLTGTDNVGNSDSITRVVKVDTSGPTAPSLAFAGLTNAFASGTTVYFKGGSTGGFTVTPSATDGSSGIASYSYPALSGFGRTGGDYTFDGSSTTQSGAVTATSNAGVTGPGTTFTAQVDSTAPTAGALVVNGGSNWLSSGTTLTIDTRTNFAETQSATESGLASSILTIQSATLTGGVCGAYGSASTITGTTSQTVASGNCYLLTLTGTDNVGNTTSLVRTVRVDTTAPSAPTGIAVSGTVRSYYPGSGTKIFFKGGSTGGFTVTASGSTDADSDVDHYDYGSLTGFAGGNGTYLFDNLATTQTGSISAVNNAGLAGAGLSFTAQADTNGPTGGDVTVNGGAAYLTSGTSVSISTTNFDETASATESGLASNALTVQAATLSGDTCGGYGPATDITGQSSYPVASGNCYRFTLTGTDNVGNATTATAVVKVDTTAPAAPTAITASNLTNAWFPGSGTTVYFKGGATGGFTVSASGATDADTAIASYGYSSLTGFTGAGTYSFDAGSTTQTGSATATNNAGLTGPGLAFTARADSAAPTGGDLTVNGGGAYLSSGSTVSLAVTPFDETQSATQSGIDTNALTVEDATLAGGSCGGYGSVTDITGQSSYTVATGHCYRFTLTGMDKVGNAATVTKVVKVDTSAPSAPSLAFSGSYASGNTVYFKSGSTGTFTVTPTSSDAESDVASYAFPSLAGIPHSGGDYSFDGSSTTQSGDVTATNNAGLTGAGTTFTAQADGTAPTGGALTVNGGAQYLTSGTSVTVSATDYAEAQSATESGLASSTLTVESAALAGDSCGTYGGTTDISGQSSYAVASGNCYRFTLTGTDNVGNSDSITRVVKVDTSAPSAPATLTFGGLTNAYANGTTVYFKGGTTGGFTVTGSGAADGQTGVASYAYGDLNGFGRTGNAYTFDGSSTTQTGSVTAVNGAGTTGSGTTFTAEADSTAPSSTISCNGSACPSGWTNSAPIDIALDATDAGADVASITYTTDGSDPASSGTATTVSAATATFQLSSAATVRWLATDNVGNVSAGQSVTLQIDATAPSAPTTFSVSGTTNAFFDGDSTVFFQGGGNGGFTLTASGASDAQSGIQGYDYPALSGFSHTGGQYTFDGSSTTQTGSVTATNNAATTGAGKTFTAQSDSTAPSTSVQCNGAACSAGWYSSSPVHLQLSGDDGSGSGVASITYTTDGTDPTTSGTATTGSTVDVTALGTTTVKWVATDEVGNVSAVDSVDVKLDTTAPTAPGLSFSGSYANGDTVYFKTGSTGTFTVTPSATDGQSGVASYAFPALTGFVRSGGDYTWDGSSTTQNGDVTATNNAGLTSSATTFTARADGVAPTGGDVTVNGGSGYLNSGTSVSIAVTNFDETQSATQSGIAANALTVESATLSGDACATYGAPTTITGQSSYTVASGNCYRFTLTGTDHVGNAATATATVKVDTTAPTGLALAFASPTGGAYYPGTGTTVYFDPSTAGSIDVTPSATDGETGVAYTYPTVGGNWSRSGSTYSYTAPAGAGGTQTVTATNAAGGASTIDFDLTADTNAPITTAQCNAAACGNGWFTSAPVHLTLGASDGGSGVQQIRYTVDGSTPTVVSGTAYTSTIDVSTTTTFTFRAWDNVGNAEAPQTLTIRVDDTAPTFPALSLSESSPFESVSGTTLFYNPSPGNSGSFDVTASPSDAESGIDTVTFPTLTGMSRSGNTYSWDDTATTEPGAATVTAANGAGLTTGQGFTVTEDVTAPTGVSISYTAGFDTTGSVAFSTNDGSDTGAGVATGTGVVERRTASLADGVCDTSWSAWTTVAGSPDTVATNTCVQYRFRISDKVGNETIATGGTVKVDTQAPQTAFDLTPNDPSPNATPTVQFHADEASTFECKLDGGSFGSCSSPDTLATLSEGSHTLQVRATDTAGNVDASPASYTWFVDLTAPTVSLTAPADGSNVSGTVTLSSSASDNHTASPTVAYEAKPHAGSTWTVVATAWDTTSLGDGQYDVHAVATDGAGNSTTSAPITVDVDNHAPSVSFTAPGQYVNAASPASISLTVSSADTDIVSVQFFECSNSSPTCAAGTWSPIGSAVTGSGPWTTAWTPPAGDGVKAVKAVATDGASNTGSAVKAITVDRTAPSGLSIAYAGGYSADGSVSLTTGNGPDADVDGSSGLIETRTATLGNDSCTGWSGWTTVAGPTDTVADGRCAQYRYTVSDNAGNPATVNGANTVKVDQTAPTGLSLGFSGLTNAFASGTTVFVKTGGAGGFTVAASATDGESGLGATDYPSLGSGWSATGGAYTFTGAASAPSGQQTVTVHNGAGLTSTTQFDVVADVAAPTGGSVSYTGGFTNVTSVDVTLAAGTDNGGSGIDTRVLERADATLTGGTCDTFSAFAPLATAPASPYSDATVQSGHCYEYRYVVTDEVGNVATYASIATAKVDTASPTATMTDPGTPKRGTFALSAAASDTGGSAVDHVDFQLKLHTDSTWTTVGSDSTAPYSVPLDSTSPQLDGDYDFRAVAHDAAGNTGASAAVGPDTVDNTAPNTTIGTKPTSPSNVSAPQFGYGSTEAGSTYECRVDGAAFAACANPVTLPTLGEGPHTFDVRATDAAGNTDPTPATYTWTVDTVPPAASMTSPGAHIRGTVSLASTSTDAGGTGVASVAFEVSPAGASTWSSIAGSSWDTTSVTDGLYDLHVIATDNAGNVATSSAITNVRVDNTAPAFTISNPLSNGGVSGTVSLTTNVTSEADPSPAAAWSYKLATDSTWTPLGAASWATAALPDDQYDVRVTLTDWAGNTATQTATNITVDNHAPISNVTAPADGGYVNAAAADPYTLTATATDNGTGVQQVDFYTCATAACATRSLVGTDTTPSGSTYSVAWNVPSDGQTWIEAEATDNVGHTSTSIVSVTVDRTLPDTTILTKPGDPTNDANPSFTFTADEATQKFECRLDGGSWTTCASPYSLAATPADGSHTLEIRAVDLAGNTDASADSWTWLEDRTAPTATMTDPAAANAAHAVRATIALGSTTADPGANASGLDTTTYEYSADGTTWVPVAAPGAWDTTAIDDGSYQLHVVVTDRAGNVTTSAPITALKIDNTLPVTAADDPGQYLRSTIHLTGTSADPKAAHDPAGAGVSGIDHVDFQVSPTGAGTWTTIGSDTSGPFDTVSYDYDTIAAALADGHYDFRTVAYDVAGNSQAGAPVVNRLVDNTKPTVSLADPGQYLHGTVSLSATPADAAPSSGIASTIYEVSPAGANTWTQVGQTWNTTGVADGSYDVRATTTDGSGNVSTPSVVGSRLVDNTKPHTTASGVPAGFSATDVTVTLNPSDAGSGVSDTIFQVDGGATQHGTTVVVPAAGNDGTHVITFQSVDRAGNVEDQQSVSVQIDATPPACPTCSAADYLHGTVHLTATPDDSGAGIESVAFQYSSDGGSTWTTIGTDSTGSGGTYAVDWATGTAGDGAYDLRARIKDNAGNFANVDLHGGTTVVVDNTAPTAGVGAPTNGTTVHDTVTITATSSDANPLTIDYLVDGSQLAGNSWNTTTVGDGPHTIQVRATDPAGNSTTSAGVTVTVDNLAPTPTLNDPGAAVSGTPTLGVSTDGDTANVEYQERKQGASSWTSIGTVGPSFAQTWNTTALTDGTYELRAIATDGAGHTGTSPVRTVLVDNTNPTGALTVPTAGDTVGGPNAPLNATATDAGAGVQSVKFEYSDGTWHTIATVTSAPYSTTWNAQSLATGDYQLHLVIADAAGNTRTTTPVTVHVDSSAPTVTFTNPGASLSGTVALSASTAGPGAVSVTFEYSVHGANAWNTIKVDNASPWSASWNTAAIADGSYDVRVSAADDLGNVGTSTVYTALVDNRLPTIAAASPADGSTVASTNAISLDLSEGSTLSNITLDGNTTVAPTVTGTHVSFATGALTDGPHTLALTLTDAAGHAADARLHFTIFQPSGGSTPPAVEANTSPNAPTTITSADGTWSMTVPAGAMPAGSDPNTWVVVRLAPTTPALVPPSPAGVTLQRIVEIIAQWTNGSGRLHHFDVPLDIAFRNATGLVPATAESGGSWRMISHVNGSLASNEEDGWYRDGSTLHVLTRHLTLFGLAVDQSPPTAPHNFNAKVNDGQLILYWDPADTDASGSKVANYTVYVDGVSTKQLGASEYQYEVGPYDQNDTHSYTVVAIDEAGHTGPAATTLRVVPSLVGLQLDDAKAALVARGFTPGDVTVADSDEPEGTVLGAPTVGIAAGVGSVIPLQVSAGPSAANTKFVFSVVTSKRLVLSQRMFIGVHIAQTKASLVTATLVGPKGKTLATWKRSARAGVSIVRLALPKAAKTWKHGTYRLRWRVVAGADSLQRTIAVQIGRTKKDFPKSRGKKVDVVVAGSALPAKLPLAGKTVAAVSESSAFELTGDPKKNVGVIVIDADQYTLGMIHDLHTVFPTVKLIALSNNPARRAAAVRAGATVGLPKTTTAPKLAKVASAVARR